MLKKYRWTVTQDTLISDNCIYEMFPMYLELCSVSSSLLHGMTLNKSNTTEELNHGT